ncbi:MAG: hypothetical protein P8X57_09760 [Cyclobacteriaceae bacterium]
MKVRKELTPIFISILIAFIAGMSPQQVFAQLSGTYTIGGGGDYASINAAVAALDASGVSGPVTFNISSGTYTEQVTIPAISGASSTNTITFTSASGNPADVNWEFNGINDAVIWLDGASHLRFRDMTIRNT